MIEAIQSNSLAKKLQGFLAGIVMFSFLALVGFIIRDSVINNDLTTLRLALFSTFLGVTQGYYLGRAAKNSTGPIFSFLFGITVALTAYITYQNRINRITLSLFLGTVAIFLLYTSEIIDGHEKMEDWIEYCKTASWFGLGTILFLEFILPVGLQMGNLIIGTPSNVSEIISRLNNTDLVIGIIALFIIFIVGVKRFSDT